MKNIVLKVVWVLSLPILLYIFWILLFYKPEAYFSGNSISGNSTVQKFVTYLLGLLFLLIPYLIIFIDSIKNKFYWLVLAQIIILSTFSSDLIYSGYLQFYWVFYVAIFGFYTYLKTINNRLI